MVGPIFLTYPFAKCRVFGSELLRLVDIYLRAAARSDDGVKDVEILLPSEEEVSLIRGGDEVVALVFFGCCCIFLARAAAAKLISLVMAAMGPPL